MPRRRCAYSTDSASVLDSIVNSCTAVQKGLCSARIACGLVLLVAGFMGFLQPLAVAATRSTYVPRDTTWVSPPVSRWMAFDGTHQQIFTAWPFDDRVDVVSATDYHLIHSIPVPSPSTLDISPDGTTVAVGTRSSHILFFDTGTFAKTNDIVFPDASLGISAFVYTSNGNAMIRAEEGLSTGGGITAYWDHASNSFQNVSVAGEIRATAYNVTGPIARSGDYSKIMLSGQIIDGDTGEILETTDIDGDFIGLAANYDASRYAICTQIPGAEQTLVILDSTYDEIFQDSNGCLGMTVSGDGTKLYRDVPHGSGNSTEILDLNTLSSTYVPNYFSSQGLNYPTFWQAADSTGMVYGINSNTAPNGTTTVVWIALDTTETTAPTIPSAGKGVQILRVLDNVGSPQGGDTIRILCTGISESASVTIGGTAATNVQLTAPGTLPGSIYLTAQTPSGMPGWADVTVASNGNTVTAAKAFQYAASRTIIPFATQPTYLLYDPQRNRLYASHKDQVEVIDVASETLLAPIVPAGGKLPNSQFAGLSLSLDGQRLYVADYGAGLIHTLNLANPGTGSSIDPAKLLGLSAPITPGRVFELSNGKLIGTAIEAGFNPPPITLFLIDPASMTAQLVQDSAGQNISALGWNTMNHGERVLLTGGYGDADWGKVGTWGVNSDSNLQPSTTTEVYAEATANEDGTIISIGGSTPGSILPDPEILDFNSSTLGYVRQHLDAQTPVGTPSFFLDPTGALLYKAGMYEANGGNSFGGSGNSTSGVEVDDMHTYQPAERIVFPEGLATSYTPFNDHMFTADPTGRYVFGVTQSGITMMQLYAAPLSIGNVQPPFLDSQSTTTLTVRGTGFVSGAEVSIGGKQANTTYVDANTLNATVPQLTSGWQDVTVTLPGGVAYTAAGMLQVLGNQPTPVVTGFSPASVVVQPGIPGFDKSADVTVLGSNFESYDTVEINGAAVLSAFIDSGHMQATIPSTLTGQTGSLAVSVVSPYSGSSNSLGLPMVNPVPVPENNPPIYFAAGSSFTLYITGTNFVAGSIIQWNGQNLPTTLIEGENGASLEAIYATVPASMTNLTGNATVAVYNPPPGGGVSPPITATIGVQPVPWYEIFGPNNSGSVQSYYSIPPSIDFGTQVLNTTYTLTVYIQSVGNSGYNVTSVGISGGAFSTSVTTCQLPQDKGCSVPITFSPTATGPATGVLTITDNLPGSPHSVPLTGNVIQTPLPVVTLTGINALDQTITATMSGTAVVGGASIPATAWIEYSTDQSLSTYSQSASWTFTGDGNISGSVAPLTPNTLYAARIAVQTAGGIGRSAIHLFSTAAAWPWVWIGIPQGGTNTATVKAGQTATYSLDANDGGNGYVGTAALTCTGAPVGATCTISPAQVSVGLNATPFTVTVTTTAAQASDLRKPNMDGPGGLSLAFMLTAILLIPRKRNGLHLLIASIGIVFVCVSCGSGGSGGGNGGGGGGGQVLATQPGTYTLTVSGTTQGVQSSYSLQLTVQ